MTIKTPRVAFVNVSNPNDAEGGAVRNSGTLSRDGLNYLNSLEGRISDLEAMVQILLVRKQDN